MTTDDTISRQAAIDVVSDLYWMDERLLNFKKEIDATFDKIKALPPAQPEGYIKIPETGIDDLSDGFHTFRQLYYQRMMLFATIVKQNKDKAWKSLRHEDGELCFGGGWFIVGIDTPEGSYTYHYEDNYFSLFDCEELEHGKHWDGHTEKDVTRLLSLPPAQQWIPCSERLPKAGIRYQVTFESGEVGYADFHNKIFLPDGSTEENVWEIEQYYEDYGEVIAWMPLPEPYREERCGE